MAGPKPAALPLGDVPTDTFIIIRYQDLLSRFCLYTKKPVLKTGLYNILSDNYVFCQTNPPIKPAIAPQVAPTLPHLPNFIAFESFSGPNSLSSPPTVAAVP